MCERDGLLLRRHAIDLGGRAEQLFTVDVVLRRDVRQHRRLKVVAVALAAGDDHRALLDRAPDLILEAVGRDLRGQRPALRLALARITLLHSGERGRELLEERLVELVDNDEPFRAVARLARVVDPRGDCVLDRLVEVVSAEDDERVGAAELENDLLQMPASDLRDGGAGALRAGDGYAADARIGDYPLDLLVHVLDVHVCAGWYTPVCDQRRYRLGHLQ